MPEVELVAICGLTEAEVRPCIRQYGIPEMHTDYRHLLAIAELDAVVVAVPNHLHAEISVQALRHGKHVLCERPVGISSSEARAVERAVDEAGRVFLQRLPHRFEADSLLARTFVQKGHLGAVRWARASTLRRQARPNGWYTSRRHAGGGALLHLGLPLLDLVLWFLEYPAVERVSASAFQHGTGPSVVIPQDEAPVPTRPWERLGRLLGRREESPSVPSAMDAEDTACALLHLSTGVAISLEASWLAHGAGDTRQVAIYGDQGGIEMWPLRLYRVLEGVPVDVTPQLTAVDENAALARHFIDCVVRGETPRGSVGEGRALMTAIESLYRAADQGAEVRLETAPTG
jgi:predicted dehydrogenase